MEENKEKKYIKISLGTFTVLIVALLILVMAIVLAVHYNDKISNTPQQTIQNQQLDNKVSN